MTRDEEPGVQSSMEELRLENERLRKEIERLQRSQSAPPPSPVDDFQSPLKTIERLSRDHVERYSRQLLLSEGFGVPGQKKLLSSSVLVVGAGGIGSTVILYLAACGVGRITIVDFDRVEVSNLHRQVIHDTLRVGQNKSESACASVRALNPQVQCRSVPEPLTHRNALELVSHADCVVDASDNPQTRYLLNDACVLAGKPLVSGSAIGTEGQLTVYNHIGSQCYRCLYPNPPQSSGCKTCADNGVFGPVPGLIGVLQATETVKVLTGVGTAMSTHLLMYDSLGCSFMRIKKPPKNLDCASCGPHATIRSMDDSQITLASTLGPSCAANVAQVTPHDVSCSEYRRVRESGEPHVLLDVRVREQFELCSLPGSVHVPLGELPDRLDEMESLSGGTKPVYCVCRRGVASSAAADVLNDARRQRPGIHSAYTVAGGLTAWQKDIDPEFPKY